MRFYEGSILFSLLGFLGGCDSDVPLGALGGLEGANAPEHWSCEPGAEVVAPETYVPQNHPDCPEGFDSSILGHGQPCDVPIGSACAYQQPEGSFTACVCGCGPTEAWSCFGRSGGMQEGCPDEQPESGTECSGSSSCHYLSQETCTCTGGQWSCEWDPADPATTPEDPTCFAGPWAANTEPSGIAACTPVNELSMEDATAWCAWYTAAYYPNDDDPEPEVYPVNDGSVSSGASSGCGFMDPDTRDEVGLCIQHLGVEQCVANLLHGDCPLALGQVEDCARTMINECRVVQDGCGPLYSMPACHKTVVQVNAHDFCSAPVD